MNLKQRLIARNGDEKQPMQVLRVPSSGRIDADTVAEIHRLALAARDGDIRARDVLYEGMRPRLHRIGTVVRPWPNTPHHTGIWDRDDVHQESWIIYVELLAAWDASVSFVPYFLARFAWRLRDRILRGIGKSRNKFGQNRVPESALKLVLYAGDEEQPESAVIARKLLEYLLQRHFSGVATSPEIEAWLEVVNNRELNALSSEGISSVSEITERHRRVG